MNPLPSDSDADLDHGPTLRHEGAAEDPAAAELPDLDYGPTLRGLRTGMKLFGARYTLQRVLGRGGMGVVWLARDAKLDLDVALKFLPDEMKDDRVAIDDLRRETRRCLQLTHPLIVRIYDLAESDGYVAIAMEYVEGSTLNDLRLDRPSRVFEAADIEPWVRQVCEALAYAHGEAKVVHRDLKPANVMICTGSGRVKLADFGISSTLSDTMSQMTRPGDRSVSGTLPYMSPQQVMGERATESDDIYSLGATLYELLTGKPPFFSGEIFEQIKIKTPPPITERRAELDVQSQQTVPDAWERGVLSCLAKKPEDRPASIASFARMLDLSADFPESAPNATKPSGVRGLDRAFERPEDTRQTQYFRRSQRLTSSFLRVLYPHFVFRSSSIVRPHKAASSRRTPKTLRDFLHFIPFRGSSRLRRWVCRSHWETLNKVAHAALCVNQKTSSALRSSFLITAEGRSGHGASTVNPRTPKVALLTVAP